uniref:Tau95 domain-containing protein n=1 Tax=Caenorhabditis tropicalis TaxID=1561998 RepID=A0A1I7UPN3_9PELO
MSVVDFDDSKSIPAETVSDCEGYVGEDENFTDQLPKLQRTTSSLSVLLDAAYINKRWDRVWWNLEPIVSGVTETYAKTKKRKMMRIRQKHTLLFSMRKSNNEFFDETRECHRDNFPVTNLEIARTKICMRQPRKYERFEIPRVYGARDKKLLGTVAELLKDCVKRVIAKDGSYHFENLLSFRLQELHTHGNKSVQAPDDFYMPQPSDLASKFLELDGPLQR